MAKNKPRGRGEGSIHQRKDDGRWVASFFVEGTGKRKYLYGKTRKEAYDKLQKAMRDQEQGKLAMGPQQTVNQYIEDWLENVHRPALRENSYVLYRQLLDLHILPTLGHVKLQKLTSQQIQTLYARKLKDGLSAETVRAMHRLLHKAFDDAVHWKRMNENPCDNAKQPRKVKYEIHLLTQEQARMMLDVAQGHTLEALLTMAVATGMRRGELLSLKWQDINVEERRLQIRRTMNRIAGRGIVESEPKTEKSKRTIMLPQFVIDALMLHRKRQAEIRVKAGSAWQENDLVFPNTIGKFMATQDMLNRFKKLLKEAGLPNMRFHDLRHSAATIMLGMGVHPKLVQELLGHSNISITLDTYSHVLPSMQRDMMDGLDNLFKKR